jgi:hypothetical protein
VVEAVPLDYGFTSDAAWDGIWRRYHKEFPMTKCTQVKDNTHGMSTLVRMDTVDGMTVYGLV